MSSVGQTTGGYRFLRRLGGGSMGPVFEAEDSRDSAHVAIKVLASELAKKPKVLDRFLREARATTQIRCPGIANTLDFFVHDDHAFVISELLEGESLGTYVRRTSSLDVDLPFLLGVGAAAAAAVGAAHAAGVIHRDLNPSNIYLHLAKPSEPDVTVKILDFGIARLSQEEDGPSQTTSGLLVGTPAYMSPEQCRGATGIDARSDIYSLGCVLYEALCGRPPFVTEGMGDLIIAHVSQAPEPPARLVPGLSPKLNSLVLWLLAKKPAERPQTMTDVLRALRECARGMRIEIEGAPLRPHKRVEALPALSGGKGGIAPAASPARRVAGESEPVAVLSHASAPPSPSHPAQDPMMGQWRLPPEKASVRSGPGGTMMFDDREPPGRAPPVTPRAPGSLRSAPSADADHARTIRANPGGTMMLDDSEPTGDALDDDHPEDRTSDRTIRPARHAGPSARTRAALREHARGLAIAGAAALVGLTGTLLVLANSTRTAPAVAAASQEARPPRTLDTTSDTVEIEIHGLPAGTPIFIDGQPVGLPIKIPRGPELHRIVLGSPAVSERTIEVDGTRDRLIELVMDR